MAKKKIAKTTQKEPERPSRYLWADGIRIIAIFLVVAIHASSLLTSKTFPFEMLYPITVISVPLFIMLSGALLLPKEESYKTFFKKRCLKVLVPWIIWTVIYMYFDYYLRNHDRVIADFFVNGQSAFEQWARYFVSTFLSKLWFLPLIFSLYLLTPIFRIFVRNASKKDLWYTVVIWFITASLLPAIYPSPLFPNYQPSLLLAPIQYSGYFIAGYLLTNLYTIKIQKPFFFILLGIFPFILLALIANIPSTKEFAIRFLSPGAVVASVVTFIFLYSFITKNEKHINPIFQKVIVTVSGASLGIYLIHEIVLYFIYKLYQQPIASDYLLLLAIVAFAVSALLVVIIKKIPLVKYIVP